MDVIEKKTRKCYHEGHVFEGKPEKYVIGYNPLTQKEEFSVVIFCHIACVRAHLRENHWRDPHLIVWYEKYLRITRGLTGELPTAPSANVLACFRDDGEGISIEEFRRFEISTGLYQKDETPHVHPAIFLDCETQKDNPVPLDKIIAKSLTQGNALYANYLKAGKFIPKAIAKDNLEQSPEQTIAEV